MLSLNQITKTYVTGALSVEALRGINISFRKNEFVSILGPSGCGKTTLLNIIGGLDRYTTGDLCIGGVSTKQYKSRDWDTYRNHSIGFVFQSYNLIPHQTVLSNVELALTLSGVSKAERRKRAKEVLNLVGLGAQMKKKPNQMSGGQMQRVAIARALINNPEILLADEPTGALDSETSIQVMDLLREVAKDRLVIMVTHNPDLAAKYSTRIIRLHDGRVTDDTNPFTTEEEAEEIRNTISVDTAAPQKKKKASMSLLTAFALSLNNLMTKKARTALTAIAGSIGIIGIALIMAVSTGVNNYIADVQEDTLSSYPIQILKEQSDMSSLISSLSGSDEEEPNTKHEDGRVYSSPVLYDLVNAFISPETHVNNLADFKAYLESPDGDITEYVNAIQYQYDIGLNTYVKDENGNFVNSNVMEFFKTMAGEDSLSSSYFSLVSSMSSSMSTFTMWEELITGTDGETVSDMVKEQYDIYGEWPTEKDEVVIVVGRNNVLPDMVLYALGLMSSEEMSDAMMKALAGQKVEYTERSWSYDDLMHIEFSVFPTTAYYKYDTNTDTFVDVRENDAMLKAVVENGMKLKVTGIITVKESTTSASLSGYIGYTHALAEDIIRKTAESDVVTRQLLPENSNRNVITGLPFEIETADELNEAQKADAFLAYLDTLSLAERAQIYRAIVSTPSDSVLQAQIDEYLKTYQDKSVSELIDIIANQFSEQLGYSKEVIHATLDGYSKEQLIAQLTDTAKGYLTEAYAKQAEAQISLLLATPTEEELAVLMEQIRVQIPTIRVARQQVVLGYYLENTALSSEAIGAYLNGLDDAAFNAVFESVLHQSATKLYQQYSSMQTDETANGKLCQALTELLTSAGGSTLAQYYDRFVRKSTVSSETMEEVLEDLHYCVSENPSAIIIYPKDFASKESIVEIKDAYNNKATAEGRDEDVITYTDLVELIISSVTTILAAVEGVLIAFVSISLIVSSIMIGIITYISVLERTKEIGILRAMGASKRDISNVFNAETLLIGFGSGAFGIGVTLILCPIISAIIHAVIGEASADISAVLPIENAIALVLISMCMTLIAGIIPSMMAAKKDPVIALRSE